MHIVSREGERQEFCAARLRAALSRHSSGLSPLLDLGDAAGEVRSGVVDGMGAAELGQLTSQLLAGRTGEHPDYGLLAGRVEAALLHHNVPPSVSHAMRAAHTGHPELASWTARCLPYPYSRK